jgi:type VI secretion system protein ImpK
LARTSLAATLEARPAEAGAEWAFDRLALLYEPVFTVIARVHSGREPVRDTERFRDGMMDGLRRIRESAARRGYSSGDIDAGNFAVVAFVDEAILTAPEGGAEEWKGKTLCEELYGLRDAGEVFFKRLEALRARPDSQELGEVLEIYYLCLLMGYEGRFGGAAKGELLQLILNLRERIEFILGRKAELSPDVEPLAVAVQPTAPRDQLGTFVKIFALASALFALVCFIAFSIQLRMQTTQLQDELRQKIGLVNQQ